MKENNTKVSIFTNSNRVISDTFTNWESVREGSLARFGGAKVFYTVNSAKKLFYIKPFKREEDYRISVVDGFKTLLAEDQINISFKEYYVLEAKGNTKGKTFKHFSEQPEFDSEGNVTSPGKTVSKIAKSQDVKFSYGEYEDRIILPYSISFVNGDLITLNKDLPKNVNIGKISCEKWEIFLENKYMGKDARNVECQIIRDFTPNLSLPLLPNFSPSNGALTNQALKILDQEIHLIKVKLGIK